jgi:hypothetical protein
VLDARIQQKDAVSLSCQREIPRRTAVAKLDEFELCSATPLPLLSWAELKSLSFSLPDLTIAATGTLVAPQAVWNLDEAWAVITNYKSVDQMAEPEARIIGHGGPSLRFPAKSDRLSSGPAKSSSFAVSMSLSPWEPGLPATA